MILEVLPFTLVVKREPRAPGSSSVRASQEHRDGRGRRRGTTGTTLVLGVLLVIDGLAKL